MDPSRNPRAGRRTALTARLRRWLRPPRTLRPTRAGWSFFLITFGVGFAALNTGNNLLYLVMSLMLAFLVLSGVLSEAALRGIRVRRRLPRELFAGSPATVALEVINEQRRVASFAIVVEDHIQQGEAPPRTAGRVFALRIGAGETVSLFYRLTPTRRGPLHFTRFEVFTRFPFGLFSKARRIELDAETLVYPQIEPAHVSPKLGRAQGGGDSRSGPGGQGVEVSGLREYARGDSVRRIHWRASAHQHELMVRELQSQEEAETEVRLHTRGVRTGRDFESQVARAASEVVAHLDAGHRVALRSDDRRYAADRGAGHRAQLLSFLALVQPHEARKAEAA